MNKWKWCMVNENNEIIKGWKQENGHWYHLNKTTGVLDTGWFKDTDGRWYFANSDGEMQVGWIQDQGKWYYLEEQSNGFMGNAYCNVTATIDGKQYVFDNSCAMTEESAKASANGIIISYDYGHGVGNDRGADGIVNEEQEVRRYGAVVVRELEKAGYSLVDCTPTDTGMSLSRSLSSRVEKANRHKSKLHLCFHINAFDGNGHGAEIEVASDRGEEIAEPILRNICELGFANRGIKRPSLYVTGYTDMTALLIEPFFCDNQYDCSIYNPETLGKAIADGVKEALQ